MDDFLRRAAGLQGIRLSQPVPREMIPDRVIEAMKHSNKLKQDMLDTIAALYDENERLRADNATLRELLEHLAILQASSTEYEHWQDRALAYLEGRMQTPP